MRITGAAAQFGRGVMQDVSAKMMKRFAECLAEEMAEPAAGRGGAGEAAPAPRAEHARRRRASRAPPRASRARRPSRRPRARRPASRPARRRAATEDVLDLGEVGREAVLKRALPVVGVVLALFVLLRLIRR